MRYTQVASLFSLLLLACCGPSANPPGVPQSLEAQEGVTQLINYPGIKHVSKTGVPVAPEKRDDAANIVQQWLVGAPEIVTQAQINEASGFLHSLTNTVPKKVSRSDGLFLFWVANMTQAQADQASKHSGIASVELNQKVAEARVPRVQSSPPKPRQVVYFETQEMAVTELAAISQPSGVPDLHLFPNYVYESHAGSQSFVYHIESGVAVRRHAAEFPRAMRALFTPAAREYGLRDDDDNSDDFHSTCTADKAVGHLYGAAKMATLIPVVRGDDNLAELVAAVEEVASDLGTHPERRGFSVVSVSLTTDGGGRQSALCARAISKVMRQDVPVVVSAGNYAGLNGRDEIDTFPALLASRDFPLIVVGSCNRDGLKSDFSQVGDELTIYAVGEDITCFEQGNEPTTGNDGTSYSTPIVAGHIANLLSYNPVPIDTSTGNLVRNMRDYLKTDPGAGWVRSGGIRVLWNGVTEQLNPKFKYCAGLASNKYVERETLRKAIEDDFCNQDLRAPLAIIYNEHTMEEVSVALDMDGTDPDPGVISKDGCLRYLLAEVTDGCDGNDPTGNPANYKGGGRAHLGGVTYRIEPHADRQPANLGKNGGSGCDSTYKLLFNDFTVWGHGWASDDFGDAFKRTMMVDCGLFPDTFKFEYGLGDDGREWTAWFHTVIFKRSCVSWVAKVVGAPEDFTCNGSG